MLLIPILFPFYWMVISSVKTFVELLAIPPTLWPQQWNWNVYGELFSRLHISVYFRNSVVLALLTALLSTFGAALAAYSFTTYRYWGRHTCSRLILFIYMFPQILVVIPLYILLTNVGLINTHIGLLVTYLAFQLPVCIWVLKAYFTTLPIEMLEAAQVDGLTKVGVLFRMVLPLAAPGIAAASILAFIGAWNEFLFANVFLVDDTLKTLPVVIVDYHTRESVQWTQILASSTVISIPSFLFALFAQKYLVSGLTAGAVKS
jgi:ABC-type glycerol-3-phosphate transport system permease component